MFTNSLSTWHDITSSCQPIKVNLAYTHQSGNFTCIPCTHCVVNVHNINFYTQLGYRPHDVAIPVFIVYQSWLIHTKIPIVRCVNRAPNYYMGTIKLSSCKVALEFCCIKLLLCYKLVTQSQEIKKLLCR